MSVAGGGRNSNIVDSDVDTSALVLLREKLPWELVLEFNSLWEILRCRRTGRLLALAADRLSSSSCSCLLDQWLRSNREQIVLIPQKDNEDDDDGGLVYQKSLFSRRDGHSFQCLLRVFRVICHLPMEAAIAYNGKYGRHAIPLVWNDDKRQLIPDQPQPPCTRRNCPTCRFQIPTTTATTTTTTDRDAKMPAQEEEEEERCHTIDDYLQIHNVRGESLDLTTFYPKCIPNLPPDMVCPKCCKNDERTLVLSMLSYQSSGVHPLGKPMTYTPAYDSDDEYNDNDDDDDDNDNDDNDDDNDDESIVPTTKRAKRDAAVSPPPPSAHDASRFVYPPPLYDDVAIPQCDRPVVEKDDAKYALAIHCVACRSFGIVGPANPCHHPDFACFHQQQQQQQQQAMWWGEEGGGDVVVGIVLVRNLCHDHMNCPRGTLCSTCSRQSLHQGFARTGHTVTFKSNCNHCHPHGTGRYCTSCSWMTTCCHHW